MAAFIGIELGAHRLPSGVPDRIAVFDIEVFAVIIIRNIVIAVAGNSQQLGIFIECIAAHCVRDQREEVLVAEVIDPGQRCLRSCDDILAVFVIKITVLDKSVLLPLTGLIVFT